MTKINLQEILTGKGAVKFGRAKEAMIISKENPGELYPEFDFFVDLLENDNKILKWAAIKVIGNLSKVDKKKKVDRILDKITAFLKDKSMVTAANAVEALTEIAVNKSESRDEILKALLRVEKAKYYSKGELSPECRNVVIGKVVDSLDKFGEEVLRRKIVRNFLTRQTKNPRPKVKRNSEKLLAKIR